MKEKDSTPKDKPTPTKETTQPDQKTGEKEAEVAALPPVVQSDNRDAKQPDPTKSEDRTDRKQDEAIASLANQTQTIKIQTDWVRVQAIASTFLGAVTLVVLVYHGWIMGKQSQAMSDQTAIMKGQLESMTSGSTQTQQMITATQKQADAAMAQALTSQAVVDQNKDLIAASLAQTEATKIQAQIAQQSFYIGERPYVTATAAIEEFEVGTTPEVVVYLENKGNTPAVDVQISAIVSIERLPNPPLERYRQMSIGEAIADSSASLPYARFMPEGSKQFLAAGATTLGEMRSPTLTAAIVENVTSLKQFLIVWGVSGYKDGLGKSHLLKFCMFYNPKDDMFVACPTFNSTT